MRAELQIATSIATAYAVVEIEVPLMTNCITRLPRSPRRADAVGEQRLKPKF